MLPVESRCGKASGAGGQEEAMTRMGMRGFRRQVLGKLGQYEGRLLKLEGQLLILRGKAERATGEAQVKLGELLTEMEHGIESLRTTGKAALEGLEKAADAGQALLEGMKDRLQEAEAKVPSVVAKGRAVAERAAIEAKALRHGVKVGLRVARRVSRRMKEQHP